ncbi:MAG: DNA replication/repair protein RecF [Pseudomonadota bacterium]
MIARLVLTDYRNHAALALSGGAGFVVLTGPNGAGKTNVLEALSLLAPGRGLRRAGLGEIARRDGAGGFAVAATLADGVPFATGSDPDRPERRIVRINGAAASATALAEWLTILWLTPAMDRLFVEPAGERRRFLDRLALALAPGHAVHSNRYEAAMRARNRLLAEDGADTAWLGALEQQLAEHGAAIDTARRETVALLDARLAERRGAGFAQPALALAGGAVDAATLARERSRDAAAGRTLSGPHRSDLIVTHVEKAGPASSASTGEQKALLLEIMLAHAGLVADRTGRAPVLLLDEVAAHLDPARRAALFARLAGIGQVWMTGTEDALFDGLPAAPTRITLA